MRFIVMIATHRRRDLLAKALDSLAAAARPPAFERVIVVENASNDGSREICQQVGDRLPTEYHNLSQAGQSRARQWVVERLEKGFVLFLDDDVQIAPGLLEQYARAIEEHGRGCFFGGPVGIHYELTPPSWLKQYLPSSAAGWEPEELDFSERENAFVGMNFGAFAEDILATGGFNTDLGPGGLKAGIAGNPTGHELDLQRRFLASGLRPVYLRHAKVWHYVPRERCTPRWALYRAYRNGITGGLSHRGGSPEGKNVFGTQAPLGAPWWLWRQWLLSVPSLLLSFFVPSAKRRFELRLRCYRLWGHLKGCTMRGLSSS